jgi:hypothetical protein
MGIHKSVPRKLKILDKCHGKTEYFTAIWGRNFLAEDAEKY